jgi:hypothetical protein
MASMKVKECNACGQGFDEDNIPVGNSIPSSRCADGKHGGEIIRLGKKIQILHSLISSI